MALHSCWDLVQQLFPLLRQTYLVREISDRKTAKSPNVRPMIDSVDHLASWRKANSISLGYMRLLAEHNWGNNDILVSLTFWLLLLESISWASKCGCEKLRQCSGDRNTKVDIESGVK